MKNPYLNRKMIKDPKCFFGRKNEIKRIFDEVGTLHPQNISIVGERKIGKSSLLYYILQSDVKRQKLSHFEKYIFAFVDFHECLGITVKRFWKMLYSELEGKLPSGIVIRPVKDYETFKNMVKILENSGYKLILLFDEFDSILENENFEVDFFLSLRSISNRYDIAYIVSTQKNLLDLSRKDLLGSPFFNIFVTISLGLFQKDEALELIKRPSAKGGIPLEEEAEFVLRNAGLFPFFIQMLCSKLFEYKEKYGLKIEKRDYKYILAEFQKEASPFFAYLWSNLSMKEKRLLIQIAMEMKVKDEERFLVGNLKQRGYITTINGKNHIFSDSFCKFVLDNKTEVMNVFKSIITTRRLYRIAPRYIGVLKLLWSALSILLLTIFSSWIYDHYLSGENSPFFIFLGRISSFFSPNSNFFLLVVFILLILVSMLFFLLENEDY